MPQATQQGSAAAASLETVDLPAKTFVRARSARSAASEAAASSTRSRRRKSTAWRVTNAASTRGSGNNPWRAKSRTQYSTGWTLTWVGSSKSSGVDENSTTSVASEVRDCRLGPLRRYVLEHLDARDRVVAAVELVVDGGDAHVWT